MSSTTANFNVNVKLRNDSPERVLKELAISPLIYIRLVGILFSIIVFGCVADKGYEPNSNVCWYNGSHACNFAIAIGVIAFLLCLAFLVKDVLYVVVDFTANPNLKKVLIVADICANGLWAFFWFVCFCYTADQLRKISSVIVPLNTPYGSLRAAVAFSFFAILVWVAIVAVNVFYLFRIIRGSDGPGGGFAAFPEGGGQSDSEQQPGSGYQGGQEGGAPYSAPEY